METSLEKRIQILERVIAKKKRFLAPLSPNRKEEQEEIELLEMTVSDYQKQIKQKKGSDGEQLTLLVP